MKSIRARLLVSLLAGLAVVLIVGGFVVYSVARDRLLDQLDATAEANALALSSLVTYDDGIVEFEFDGQSGGASVPGYYEFRSEDGEMLRASENLDGKRFDINVMAEDENPMLVDLTVAGDVRTRAAILHFTPNIDAGSLVSPMPRDIAIIVIAAVDRGPTDRALASMLSILLLVGGIAALCSIIIIILSVRWGLAPLHQLGRELSTVNASNISTRFHNAENVAELRPICSELNNMLDRIETALERERTFGMAAAHELRTPLAELRTAAEVALKWPDADRAQSALREALAIAGEMQRIVDALLAIHRSAQTENAGQTQETDLNTIVQRCVDRAGPRIRDNQLTVNIDVGDGAKLNGSAGAVEIIVGNLIDNAVQYTPPAGSITIKNGDTLLTVENGPVNLTEEDITHLFEPFWRRDEARSDRSHVGLGLTVVARLADVASMAVNAEIVNNHLRICLSPKK